MKEDRKTKKELLGEIGTLREKVRMLEAMQPEFRNVEKELRTLWQAIEQSYNIVHITDSKGLTEYINPKFTEVTGYTEEDMAGKSAGELGEQAEEENKEMWDTIGAGKVWRGVFHNVKKNGEKYLEEAVISPIKDEKGNITNYVKIAEDVTEKRKQEELVIKEKEKAQQYLDVARVTILALDAEGRVTLINRKGCEVTGYEYDDIIGKNWLEELIPERIKDEVKGIFFAMMRGEIDGSEVYENPIVTKSGKERTMQWRSNILTDDEGRRTGTLSSGEDITDRKKAEEVLRESEEKFKAIFDNAMDGILLVDIEDKKFLTGNPAIYEMLGYTPEEIRKIGVEDIHPKEDLPRVMEMFGKQLKKEMSLAEGVPVKGKDGSVFYADINSAPLMVGGRNCMMGMFHDITERKKAEDTLRESEEKFRSLVERANDGICILQDDKFKYVNPRLSEMLGYRPEEVIDTPFKNYLHPSAGEKMFSFYKKRMAGENVPSVYETVMMHGDGREIFVEINAGIVPLGGKDADFVIIHDITHRKRAAEDMERQRDLLNKTNKDLQWKIEELEAALSHIKALEGLIPICVNCKKIHLEDKDPKDPKSWVSLEKYISDKTDASLTHGLCPECVKKMYDEIKREKNEED